jgi:hypothetical protein
VVWAPLGDLGVCESGDVGGVELLEFERGAPAQGGMASLPVVEDLQVLRKIALASSMRVVHRRRFSSSVCIRAQAESCLCVMPDICCGWISGNDRSGLTV